MLANSGKPLVILKTLQRLQVTYTGAAPAVAALRTGTANPTALVAADFDGDGAMDVVAGYSTNSGGALALFRGNPDAYAPRDHSLYKKAVGGTIAPTFLPRASVMALPESPDLLVRGDFNRDGHDDVLVAARGGALYLLAGDGRGHLMPPQEVPLSGQVTALAASGDAHVAVSLDGPAGARLAILAAGSTGLTVVAIHTLPARGDTVAWGNLGGGADLAVGAGRQLVMIYNALGATPHTETLSVPFQVLALALGDFIWDRDGRTEIAVLAGDGTIHILQHGTLDTRPLKASDIRARRAAMMVRSQRAPDPRSLGGWKLARQLPYAQLAPLGPVAPSAFNSPRLAAAPTHDLMVLDAGQSQLTILDTSGTAVSPSAAVSFSSPPVAALALPRKINAGRDIVVLTSGVAAPTVIAAQADSSFMVTTVNDEDDAGACPSGSTITSGPGADGLLSLREAVCEANNGGAGASVVNVPAGTYPLSISTFGGSGSVYESGEIQVGNSAGANLSIVGTGTSSNTIISQTNGVDRVFEQDQPLVGNVAVSLSNVTLTGGTPTTGLDAALGGGAILGGGAAGDDLALTNVVMSNNMTASAGTGGAVNFSIANFAAANTTFANNTATQSVGGACACGSVNGQGNLVFTNSVFTGNVVTDASTLSPPAYDLGGALNLAPGMGSAATISGSVFTGNQAQGPEGQGGAIAGEGAITVSQSRIVGNSALTGSGFALGGPGSVATVIDNWWGCNAGPNSSGCDSVLVDTADGSSGTASPWLVLGLSASATQLPLNGTATLTADLTHDSGGNGGFSVPDGTSVAFGATLGTDNSTVATTTSGQASSIFSAGATPGAGGATATVDNQTVGVTLKIGQSPVITSASSTIFTVGAAGAFSVTTTGSPTPSLSESGTLPGGVRFVDNGNGTGTLSGTPSSGTAGVYHITFTAQNGTSPNATQSFTLAVNLPSTTTSLSASPNPSTYGQAVVFTAMVTSNAGTPTGTVTFKNGAASLGAVKLAGGTASITTTTLTPGSKSITAVYSGSATLSGSTSAVLSQVVNQAASAVALISSPNPSTYGQAVTLTATVSSSSGTPAGTVTFKNGTAALGTVTLTGGAASMTTTTLTPGTNAMTAVYNGNANFAGSASSILSQVVKPAARAVALISSPNPSTYGQAVAFSATVSSSSGTPTGTVTFKNGAAVLGTVTLKAGIASLRTTTLTPGAKSITAVYNGSASLPGSTSSVLSQVVNQAASAVALISSPNPSTFGQAVTFMATVSSPSGAPTGTVTFKNGAASLGSVTLKAGIASLTTTTLTPGAKSITAVYNGSATLPGSTSSVLSQVVNQGTTTVTLNSSLNPATYGQPVTFTATVSSLWGTPTGTVTFQNGGASLGTFSLGGGVAEVTVAAFNSGIKAIAAVYNGSAGFAGSTSPVLNQEVNQAPTTVTLTPSLNPSAVGQTVTYTATVTSPSGTPSGTITFMYGSTATLAAGAASFPVSWSTSGTQSVRASYQGSTDFAVSSGTLIQTVNSASTPSYTLTAAALNPSWFTPGSTSTSTITVIPANGYTGSVSLSCAMTSGDAPAPGCSLSPPNVTVSGATAGTSTLTVSSTNSTALSNYTIAVNGTDANNVGPVNGPSALTLTAVPATLPSYILSATALNPGSVTTGDTSTSTITVIPANGYAGGVTLSCSITNGGPTAPACSFNPSTVTIGGTASGTSTLTVSTAGSNAAGNYAVSVTGTDANSLTPINGPQALTLNTSTVIQHIVVIFQENRTPDNLFQDPVLISRGADIASSGMNSLGQSVPLSPIDLGTSGANPQTFDLDHSNAAFVAMYDGGKMDGANPICAPSPGTKCPPNAQYMYVNPSDVQPYFALAEQYTFGDRMFQTNEGPSYPAHQFIISGTSAPTATSPLFAASNPPGNDAGCIAPLTTLVTMIDATGSETNPAPQYPCFEHATLTDLLDAQGVTWRYYAPSAGNIWTGPNSIEHLCQQQSVNGTLVCTGPDWTNNVIIPQTQVLTDIATGQLAQVSWVIPNGRSSDHADTSDGSGPAWVASIVNAIGNSPYWANTAIIITWDDWGGWYDHVAPQVINDGVSWGSGYVYGMRVPLIVASPYAKAGYISHVTHDFGSILKFVETNFNLPSLGYADTPADNLSDCFNLSQTPLTFQTIAAPLDAAHFLNDKRPPTDPDDD